MCQVDMVVKEKENQIDTVGEEEQKVEKRTSKWKLRLARVPTTASRDVVLVAPTATVD